MDTIEFYEAIGNLFYAIASTDRSFSLLEKKRVNDIIIENWNVELGDIESKEVAYETIRGLIVHKIVWREAFDNFKAYYHENENLFEEAIKERIMHDCEAIASAYARRNKSELITLTHLSRLFWGK